MHWTVVSSSRRLIALFANSTWTIWLQFHIGVVRIRSESEEEVRNEEEFSCGQLIDRQIHVVKKHALARTGYLSRLMPPSFNLSSTLFKQSVRVRSLRSLHIQHEVISNHRSGRVLLNTQWQRHQSTQAPKETNEDTLQKVSELSEEKKKLEKEYEMLQLPVSIPGTPGGQGGTGGGGLFSLTGQPLFDAALTTVIGLGIGLNWRSSDFDG